MSKSLLIVATVAAFVLGLGQGRALAQPAPATKAKVVDFSKEADVVSTVTALPQEKIDHEPLMRGKYGKRRDLSGEVPGFEDPMPLTPQKRGCGACTATGEGPGTAGLVLAGAVLLVLVRRKRRAHCSRDLL